MDTVLTFLKIQLLFIIKHTIPSIKLIICRDWFLSKYYINYNLKWYL